MKFDIIVMWALAFVIAWFVFFRASAPVTGSQGGMPFYYAP
jgi:hypothetical protein